MRHRYKFVKLRGISGGCVVLSDSVFMVCVSFSYLPELSLVELERALVVAGHQGSVRVCWCWCIANLCVVDK